MKTDSSTLWIVLLVAVAALAVFTGFWAIDLVFKIVLYVVLAAVAVWGIMMLRKTMHHDSGHTTSAL